MGSGSTLCLPCWHLDLAQICLNKLLTPLVKYWRLHGLLIVVYIDDGICITIGLEEAKRNSKFVRDTLITAGLVPNVEKEQLGTFSNLGVARYHNRYS